MCLKPTRSTTLTKGDSKSEALFAPGDRRGGPKPDTTPYAALTFGFSQPRFTMTSAICTAFSAAPLRRLSETPTD